MQISNVKSHDIRVQASAKLIERMEIPHVKACHPLVFHGTEPTLHIVGIDVFFNDNFVNLMSVIKSAVAKFGVPKLFNFDNGSSYKNRQMNLLAARIGSKTVIDLILDVVNRNHTVNGNATL